MHPFRGYSVRSASMIRLAGFCVAACVALLGARTAQAIPVLQLYIEGATYNSTTSAYELDISGSPPGTPFRLWVIGNTAGPGNHGPISGVTLVASYAAASVQGLVMGVTPALAGGTGTFGGVTDPSLPANPTFIQANTGTHTLPPHGVFDSSTAWQEFALGNMTLTDSQLADFQNDSSPFGSLVNNAAQINVYEIVASGLSATGVVSLHFDVYGTTQNGNLQSENSPFSHDASAAIPVIHTPEPSSLALLGIGVSGLLVFGRRIGRRSPGPSATSDANAS